MTSRDSSKNNKSKSKLTLKSKGKCEESEESSHVQLFKKDRYEDVWFKAVKSDTTSGSEPSFGCVHPDGHHYTEQTLLQRKLKQLDNVPDDPNSIGHCSPMGWDVVDTLWFMVHDPVGSQHMSRILYLIQQLIKISGNGYRIEILEQLCDVLDVLVERCDSELELREGLMQLLRNTSRPILQSKSSDVVTYYDSLTVYMAFLGYLLIRLVQEDLFDIISKAVLVRLTAKEGRREDCPGEVRAHVLLMVAGPVLVQTTARMIALSSSHRFPTFLKLALILACGSEDNCNRLVDENILENMMYRFNPYFPKRDLPEYDINPKNPHDSNVRLGDSSRHMATCLSLMLVLLKSTCHRVDSDPRVREQLPCPDDYAQRCFIWAFRLECRSRGRGHERTALADITTALLHCFRKRLVTLSERLMSDVMSLSVSSEVPPRNGWISSVSINPQQADVNFKKKLISLSALFLRTFPQNRSMVVSCRWLVGLMYLLDPELSVLRTPWSPALYKELKKQAMQAIITAMPVIPVAVVKDCGIIRRLMWYIEWYRQDPYEISDLYWCLRTLQATVFHSASSNRKQVIKDVFDINGTVVIMGLCDTLVRERKPLVQKVQAAISVCLDMLASEAASNAASTASQNSTKSQKHPVDLDMHLLRSDSRVLDLGLQQAALNMSEEMLQVIVYSLQKSRLISDRWSISLLNYIWEAVIWSKHLREQFVAKNGVFKLLDLTTMSSAPVQCCCLALICELAQAGLAVGQLVSWRATLAASEANPMLIKRGATVVSLLTAVFRDDCARAGVNLDDKGVIQDMDCPLMSKELRATVHQDDFKGGKSQCTSPCLTAGEMAGSRMSKAYSLLQMLTSDLKYQVEIADEAYNLYKHATLPLCDEVALVLISNYLTLKQAEAWYETQQQHLYLQPEDSEALQECVELGRGWAKEVRRLQEAVIEKRKNDDTNEEDSLYSLLGRVRLQISLSGLSETRAVARSASRQTLAHCRLQQAVAAHTRRMLAPEHLQPVLKTFEAPLDDQNMTGQNVKVISNRSNKYNHMEKMNPAFACQPSIK